MSKPKKKFDTANESPQNILQLAKKKYTLHDLVNITPKNPRQTKFFELLYNDETKMILQSGFAGTGKSLTSLYGAFALVLDPATPYKRVLIFRSAVESRPIGFLKGTEEEKSDVYQKPYRQLTDEIFKYNDPYDNLKALGLLEFHLSSFERGCTYHDSIFIIEETQNMDMGEVRTLMTRAGKNCLIILTGDSDQNDLERKKEISCFQYVRDLMVQMPYGIGVEISYKLEDIMRSGLCKEILIADSKLDKSKYK
ncbi:hypothetical protein [Alishewanella phage vB_AspM_Slicko01]|nr:hypothetical protein [Alishewanella phage vB_AspM_Slicko01]